MAFPNIAGRVVAVDLETTGLNCRQHKIFGIALALNNGSGYDCHYWDTRRNPEALRWLVDNLPTAAIWCNHNIQFDAQFMMAAGMSKFPTLDCTMNRASLIYEHHREYSLEACLNRSPVATTKRVSVYDELAVIFGGKPTKKDQMPNLPNAPTDLVAAYAKDDALGALQLWEWQEGEIAEQSLQRVVALERNVTPCLVEQMYYGIRVNPELATKMADEIDSKVVGLRKELNDKAGFVVNPNPSSSIQRLFQPTQQPDGSFLSSCGVKLEATSSGKAAKLDADALRKLKNPLAKDVLKIRKLIKVADTFLRGHVLGHLEGDRVHPNINQNKGEDGGTGTGRLSYSAPAMQQIPNRDKELAALVRPVFLPDEGCDWSYGDLDQHEFRVFAAYVNNPRINRMYADNPNTDIHQMVADLTGMPRSANANSGMANAKQMNLAMVFNFGEGTLADVMGMPTQLKSFTTKFGEEITYLAAGAEARQVIDRYHAMIPGIREITALAKSKAEETGSVTTIYGRKIRLARHECRKAAGLIYQGSSADFNKENVYKLHEFMKSEGARFMLNIHDEYSFSIPRGKECILHEAKRIVEDKPCIKIPIRVDFSVPKGSWWDATKAPIYTSGEWSGDLTALRKRVGYNG